MTINNVNRNGTAAPGVVNGSGTLTFNIQGPDCDLIRVINDGTLDITNLHIAINAVDPTLTTYVIVDWGADGTNRPATSSAAVLSIFPTAS